MYNLFCPQCIIKTWYKVDGIIKKKKNCIALQTLKIVLNEYIY